MRISDWSSDVCSSDLFCKRALPREETLPMSALICGSLAYDTIMVFQDKFKNHILPDKVHILNVSFLVPRMRREFGGCRSEEHTSELQSLMRTSYAVFCLKKKSIPAHLRPLHAVNETAAQA